MSKKIVTTKSKKSAISKERAATIDVIINGISLIEITPGKPYSLELRSKLEDMSEEEFKAFMLDILHERNYIPFVSESFTKPGVSISNNYKVSAQLGVNFFEKVWLTDQSTGIEYLTNDPMPHFMVPVRRQCQTREYGISVPGTKLITNDLTDQVTSDAKKSSITAPEISGLSAREMTNTLVELVAVRGGNRTAYNNLSQSIIESGEGSLHASLADGSRAKINYTLGTFFTSMHIKNNI